MSLLPSTHSNNLSPRRGVVKFAPKATDGGKTAAINMSPSDSFVYSQAPETATYISAESGLNEILDSTLLGLARTMTVNCNNLSDEIKALYFGAANTAVTAAGGSVTGEESPYVFPNRSVQLGATVANGGGVFNVSAVSATFLEGTDADDWAAATTYAVGDVVIPTTPNNRFYMATAITTGTSAGSEPTFPTDGTTVTDGGVTWTDMGLITIANTSSSAYEVDAEFGVVNILSTGQIAETIAKVPASLRADGISLRLEFAYTVAASSYNRLATAEAASIEGEFWFYERNPKGTDTVWYCPSTTIAPSGDFSGKSGTDYGGAEFTVTVLKPAVGSAMYQNGKPLAAA